MTTNQPDTYNIHQTLRMAKARRISIENAYDHSSRAVSSLKTAIAAFKDAAHDARRYSQLPAAVYFHDKIEMPPFHEDVIASLRISLNAAQLTLDFWNAMLIQAYDTESLAASEVDKLPPVA